MMHVTGASAAVPFHLEVSRLKRRVGGRLILTNISFSLATGEILFVRGPSGVGKSLLLRSIAALDPIEEGSLHLNGKTAQQYGIPSWRAHVTYVHQSRINLKDTPADFYFQAQQFASQKGRSRGDLPAIIHDMGLEQVVLNQSWLELSGGQAQRVALAIAIALRPSVLLLDEPTSACDAASVHRVEQVLKACGCGLIWVTHDTDQPSRVGGRVLELPLGTESVLPTLSPLEQQQQQRVGDDARQDGMIISVQ